MFLCGLVNSQLNRINVMEVINCDAIKAYKEMLGLGFVYFWEFNSTDDYGTFTESVRESKII